MFERLAALGIVIFAALAAITARAEATSASVASFCETSAPFERRDCKPVVVELPHSFSARKSPFTYGLYRFELPRPAPGFHAIFIDRLTLDGTVKIDGRTVIDRMEPRRLSRQRYWPLMAQFRVDESKSEPLVVEIAVRGIQGRKIGLGELRIGTLSMIENEYRDSLGYGVLLIAMFATASLLVGIAGTLIGDPREREPRILSIISWIATFAGARSLHNLVTNPPVEMTLWLRSGLWLHAAVGILAVYLVAVHIEKERDLRIPFAIASLALFIVLSLPTSLLDPFIAIDLVFGLLALSTIVITTFFSMYIWKERDSIGRYVFAVFVVCAGAGLYDFIAHLGSLSISEVYMQAWSLPAVISLLVLILARRISRQRDVEIELQHETRRREELLRDLHDRVGSRLVALAFHAQQSDKDPAFFEEIKTLINDVRMIQSAVSTEATTLGALLADLRHLYSRIGGGRLPLHWDLSEESCSLPISPDQALAVVRIVEESVANAIKHANPTRITIKLARLPNVGQVTLDIIDDGEGEFTQTTMGGLENIMFRAKESGLKLDFIQARQRDDVGKAVRLCFPSEQKSTSIWTRLWRSKA